MPNPNQRAGARAEDLVARFLTEQGVPTERERIRHPDRGDLRVLDGEMWTVEVKGVGPRQAPGGRPPASMELAKAMDQAARARVTRDTPWFAVVKQRPRAPAGRWYWVMELGEAAALIRLIEEAST
jgi:hypothetical protein